MAVTSLSVLGVASKARTFTAKTAAPVVVATASTGAGNSTSRRDHKQYNKPKTVSQAYQEAIIRKEQQKQVAQQFEKEAKLKDRQQKLVTAEKVGIKPVFQPLELIESTIDREIAELLRHQIEQEAIKELQKTETTKRLDDLETTAMLLLLIAA